MPQTERNERLEFTRLEAYAGVWLQGVGEYGENGQAKTAVVAIGPEFGTAGPELICGRQRGRQFADVLVVSGFAFDPLAGEETTELGRLTVVRTRMSPDLLVGDLKKTGAGQLFTVFAEPDIEVRSAGEDAQDGCLVVEIRGIDGGLLDRMASEGHAAADSRSIWATLALEIPRISPTSRVERPARRSSAVARLVSSATSARSASESRRLRVRRSSSVRTERGYRTSSWMSRSASA